MDILANENVTAGEQLVGKLAAAAIEINILMADAGENDVQMIKDAITLVEKAWNLSGGQAENALDKITNQLQALEANYKPGSSADVWKAIGDRTLTGRPDGKNILAVMRELVNTTVKLDQQPDRAKIAALINYLEDFWDLGKRVSA